MEIREQIEKLKEKGTPIREIKEILNVSNHIIYEAAKGTENTENAKDTNPESQPEKITQESTGKKEEKTTKEKNDPFTTVKISSNLAINDFTKQQEECLQRLTECANTPFKDQWEYMAWHRLAIALQLSQYVSNDFYLDNRALWENLLEGQATESKRKWVITILHNFLELTFAQARIELSIREGKGSMPL